MKKQLLIVAAAAGFFYLSLSSFQLAPTFKAQNLNCTEGPGAGGTCSSAGVGCHDAASATAGSAVIKVRKKSQGLSSAPVTEYQNDSAYYVTITVTHPMLNAFGVQTEVLNDSDKNYGVVTASGHLSGDTISGIFVISSNKIPGNDSATFEWKAPSADSSDVTIYGAGVMANDDGSPMNDSLYKLNNLTLTWIPTPDNIAQVRKSINIAAYPNPLTGNMLKVNVQDISTGDYSIAVYNSTGQKMSEQHFSNTRTTGQAITVNAENWSSGVYFLHVSSSEATGVVSVVKR